MHVSGLLLFFVVGHVICDFAVLDSFAPTWLSCFCAIRLNPYCKPFPIYLPRALSTIPHRDVRFHLESTVDSHLSHHLIHFASMLPMKYTPHPSQHFVVFSAVFTAVFIYVSWACHSGHPRRKRVRSRSSSTTSPPLRWEPWWGRSWGNVQPSSCRRAVGLGVESCSVTGHAYFCRCFYREAYDIHFSQLAGGQPPNQRGHALSNSKDGSMVFSYPALSPACSCSSLLMHPRPSRSRTPPSVP